MPRIVFAIASILCLFTALPAWAQGKIVITQAKALAGNVTPGDTPGFPVVLSLPGAYIFESNLTVPSGGYGLQVNSHNVDIDMNGFLLTGGGVANYGVVTYYGESRIHDGVINRFKSVGIYIRNAAWTIDDMQIVRNGGSGIDGQGANLVTVRRSTIASNGGYGLIVSDNSVVEDNTVSGNGNVGIFIFGGGRVKGNQVSSNAQEGIAVNDGGIIADNSIRNNRGYGIANGPANVSLIDNSLYLNNPGGIRQIFNGINVYGNICVGKPCSAP